jgi:hypothetical protein
MDANQRHICGALLAIVNCHDIAFFKAAERFAPQIGNP